MSRTERSVSIEIGVKVCRESFGRIMSKLGASGPLVDTHFIVRTMISSVFYRNGKI